MKRTLIAIAAAALMPATLASAAPFETNPMEGDREMHSYILLDRTGSMSGIWDEALTSVNAYAKTVSEERDGEAPDTLKTEITLAVFDHQGGLQYDLLRRNANADAWQAVTSNEASPRGMTPLFDAIGRTISMAEEDNPERAVIVIMTDGHENASQEFTRETARAALDRAKEKGWEVIFLGADFGQFSDAEGVGVAQSKVMGMSSGTMQESMQRLATKARDYGTGEEAEVNFNDEDRAIAREEDVKDRN
ncbi:MAG: vWA domain-containing protein [Pseudomonadota bacterium]